MVSIFGAKLQKYFDICKFLEEKSTKRGENTPFLTKRIAGSLVHLQPEANLHDRDICNACVSASSAEESIDVWVEWFFLPRRLVARGSQGS